MIFNKFFNQGHMIWLLSGITLSCLSVPDQSIIDAGEAFKVLPDRVVQDNYTAMVLSSQEMTSDYQSEDKINASPALQFKFSINGIDNEMAVDRNHQYYCEAQGEPDATPMISFGSQLIQANQTGKEQFLSKDQPLTVRLDMNPVLNSFEEKGYYETFDKKKIYKEDFKGVYIAGNTDPLIWDFDNLVNHPHLKMNDLDSDGIFEIDLILNPSVDDAKTSSSWKLSRDISAYPQYISDYPLVDALYNMALEETVLNVEEDGTFRTGKEWAGVWTRDISYSILLAMSYIHPEVSKNSLLKKVKNGRIVQDTGTGGAYPVSTDRIVWAVAAWQIYVVTGDIDWLHTIYPIIKKSLEDDLKNAYNPMTHLVRGESSFLDWREQTYPKWMEPVDIYSSQNLGTNVVHYQANVILSGMAELMADTKVAEKHQQIAEEIKEALNHKLWMDEKGYYGQYLYGRHHQMLSPKSEALGEALAVLYGIADQKKAQTVVSQVPVTTYGIPSIFPQISGIPPYHNDGIWPFVQAFWAMAAAKTGNEEALVESLGAIYRPAALFLTNKENFVASTGDYAGTQINSDRQLWSVAGNLGMVFNVFYGIKFQKEGLAFSPFVPRGFGSKRELKNFRYRGAVLDIELIGTGQKIRSFRLDGETVSVPFIPSTLQGKHSVEIVMTSEVPVVQKINRQQDLVAPPTPIVNVEGDRLKWEAVNGATVYHIFKNGKLIEKQNQLTYRIDADDYGDYQVVALDNEGLSSFASEPVVIVPTSDVEIYEMENSMEAEETMVRDFSGDGYIKTSRNKNSQIRLSLDVQKSGRYAIDFRYANGHGPTNTENKACLRSMIVDRAFVGTFVFPQRGKDDWSNWGYTNALQLELEKGTHTFMLSFEDHNANMNGVINEALLDYIRFIRIE